jgi:D-inositol-3-phosphate glycosyltransferase
VVAAAVGGLTVAVADRVSGLLVDGHEPDLWASALARVILEPGERDRLSVGARRRAAQFSWDATVDGLMDSYRAALAGQRTDGRPEPASLARVVGR